MNILLERCRTRGFGGQRPGLCVDGGRREPVSEVLLDAFLEEDGELPPFGSQPEAVLASETVHVLEQLRGGDQLAVDPSETQTSVAGRSARHDASLHLRQNRHLSLAEPVLENHDVGVCPQKSHIRAESAGFDGRLGFRLLSLGCLLRALRGATDKQQRRSQQHNHSQVHAQSPFCQINRRYRFLPTLRRHGRQTENIAHPSCPCKPLDRNRPGLRAGVSPVPPTLAGIMAICC